MIDMRFRPKHLPQVSLPYEYVIEELKKDNVECELQTVNPNILEASQGIVFGENVSETPSDEPIWISKDNKTLDGHHRLLDHLSRNKPINVVKMNVDEKVGARLLNKIQDIYEYEQQKNLEEVVGYEKLNDGEEKETKDFLSMIENNENLIDANGRMILNDKKLNPKKILGYRKQTINEKSKIGNFFLLEPHDKYDKYEIQFENVLDTHNMDLNYRNNVSPVEVLCNVWFPHVNFKEIEKVSNIPYINLINRAVAEKAKKLGYDGVQYGEKLIQGFN